MQRGFKPNGNWIRCCICPRCLQRKLDWILSSTSMQNMKDVQQELQGSSADALSWCLPRLSSQHALREGLRVCVQGFWCGLVDPHPEIETTRDNANHTRVFLYSYYTTITGWGGRGPPNDVEAMLTHLKNLLRRSRCVGSTGCFSRLCSWACLTGSCRELYNILSYSIVTPSKLEGGPRMSQVEQSS